MEIKDNYTLAEDKGREKYYDDWKGLFHIVFNEDKYGPWDFKQTALTPNAPIYVGEIKNVDRAYSKYGDYLNDKGFMIDYNKCREVKKIAMNEGRKPLIVAYFTDKKVIWNLDKMPWEMRADWRRVNKDGQNYGEKEWELMTYLFLDEADLVVDYDEGRDN